MSVEGGSLTAGVAWIGVCQICRNRAELQRFDGFEACEECCKAMQHGMDKRAQEQQPERPSPAPAVGICTAAPDAVAVPPAADSDERARYLAQVKRADAALIDRIIRRLVRERVFHVEFDQVVENSRWFSLMDLRRLALEVEKQECRIPKRRSSKCPTRKQTRRIRIQKPLKEALQQPLLQMQLPL